MVAKISSNSSLFGTLNYNKLKVDNSEASLLFSRNMFEKADGSFSFLHCMKSFEPYLAVNKRTEKPVFHVSLNPDPKDKLDNEQLSEMAEKYMQSMGYENQPYIVFKHTDIDRTHLHVVSLRVDETGKKIDSNFENRRSMAVCRELEREYNLHPAEKKERTDEIPLKKVDYKHGDVKHQVSNIVKALMNSYDFHSFGEFRTLLEQLNVTAEEVRGRSPKGEMYNGIIYSATDDNGNRLGTPFKSSLFGKETGYEALQRKYEKTARTVKEKGIREQLAPVIRKAMQGAGSINELELLLKKEKIQIVLRRNEEGRIYGATLIDHDSRTVLNGSRLGKEFSANVFNERFGGQHFADDVQQKPEKEISPTGGQYHSAAHDNAESVLGGLFGLFTPEPGNGDPQQEYPPKRKKKKKHKGRSLG